MCASQRSTAVKGGESESAKSRCGRAWCGQKLQFPTRGRGFAGREVRKQVMKERCEEEGCMHAYENTSCKLTWGSGRIRWTGMCCCVWMGSSRERPSSPHTSRLFILHCGKITAPAVSSGPCKVYIACPEVHVYSTILPNSPSHKERRQTGILALYVSIIELI